MVLSVIPSILHQVFLQLNSINGTASKHNLWLAERSSIMNDPPLQIRILSRMHRVDIFPDAQMEKLSVITVNLLMS